MDPPIVARQVYIYVDIIAYARPRSWAQSSQDAAALATVRGDARARDKAGDGRGEENDEGGDFLGSAAAAEGHLLAYKALDLLRVRRLAARPGPAGAAN